MYDIKIFKSYILEKKQIKLYFPKIIYRFKYKKNLSYISINIKLKLIF